MRNAVKLYATLGNTDTVVERSSNFIDFYDYVLEYPGLELMIHIEGVENISFLMEIDNAKVNLTPFKPFGANRRKCVRNPTVAEMYNILDTSFKDRLAEVFYTIPIDWHIQDIKAIELKLLILDMFLYNNQVMYSSPNISMSDQPSILDLLNHRFGGEFTLNNSEKKFVIDGNSSKDLINFRIIPNYIIDSNVSEKESKRFLLIAIEEDFKVNATNLLLLLPKGSWVNNFSIEDILEDMLNSVNTQKQTNEKETMRFINTNLINEDIDALYPNDVKVRIPIDIASNNLDSLLCLMNDGSVFLPQNEKLYELSLVENDIFRALRNNKYSIEYGVEEQFQQCHTIHHTAYKYHESRMMSDGYPVERPTIADHSQNYYPSQSVEINIVSLSETKAPQLASIVHFTSFNEMDSDMLRFIKLSKVERLTLAKE